MRPPALCMPICALLRAAAVCVSVRRIGLCRECVGDVPIEDIFQTFEQYRVVAVDMESAAIGANAYRYRVSHATFLCVSDKPVHAALKASRDVSTFYKNSNK